MVKWLWLSLVDEVTGKKKMKKVMVLSASDAVLTLEKVSEIFWSVVGSWKVVEFYETSEAGI
jgi:hypothetical protein